MRDMDAILRIGGKASDFRVDPAESRRRAFLAAVAHQVHTKTDAEDRDPGYKSGIVERSGPPVVVKRCDAVVERTDTANE